MLYKIITNDLFDIISVSPQNGYCCFCVLFCFVLPCCTKTVKACIKTMAHKSPIRLVQSAVAWVKAGLVMAVSVIIRALRSLAWVCPCENPDCTRHVRPTANSV